MWMSASGRQQRGAPPPATPSAFDHHCRPPGPAREVARASERFHHLRSVGHSRRQTDIRSTRFRERGSPRRGRRDSHLQRGKGLGIVMMLGPFFAYRVIVLMPSGSRNATSERYDRDERKSAELWLGESAGIDRDELYIARSAKEAAWSAAEAAREPQKLSTCSQQWP
jgi:hypothetical protein